MARLRPPLVFAFLLLVLAAANAASPSKPPSAPKPPPTDCKLSEPRCGECDVGCGLGQTVCIREVIAPAANGGSCGGEMTESQHCVSSDSPLCSTTDIPNYDRLSALPVPDGVATKFTATLTIPAGMVVSDIGLGTAFVGLSQASVTAVESGAGEDGGENSTLLVTADFTGSTSTASSDNENLIAYMTLLRVDPASALGLQEGSEPDVVSVTLESSRCPADSTWQDAEDLIGSKQHLEAIAMLTHILECKSVAAADEADPIFDADVYNLLGFANRKASEPNFVYSEVFYTRALQLDAAHTPALSYLASLYLETGRQAQADETAAALAQACGNACCEDLQYLLKDYAALDSELPSGLPMCSVDASSEEQIVGGQSSAAFVPVMAPLVLVVFGMAAAAA